MIDDKMINWLKELKISSSRFLNLLKGQSRKGFYHYSLSGDYFSEKIKWGLGKTVFALKTIYTLDLTEQYKTEIIEAVNFIKSFNREDGTFSDRLINVLSWPNIISYNLKNLSLRRNKQIQLAETRQSISVLNLYSQYPLYSYRLEAMTINELENKLEELNWSNPWDGGSHFSHLLFYLNQSNLDNKPYLIEHAIKWIDKIQNHSDGFWFRGKPTLQQKINGAMKIITGLNIVDKMRINYPELIIDSLLAAKNDKHACDNFNIIYVLKYCSNKTNNGYRMSDIKNFTIDRLNIYKNYYHPKTGGFSFNRNKSSTTYYGARIARGKSEPDIHGTVMFLWGISIITQILGINAELKYREFKP